jgi:hypothetical protein
MPFFGLHDVESALRRVAEALDRRVDAFVFGGGAMAAWGVKPATRDLDIAFRSTAHRDAFKEALRSLQASEPGMPTRRLGPRHHLQTPDGMGWDLFHDNIIGFPLVPDDFDEAEPWLGAGLLSTFRLRAELVFVMKAFTPRTRDISDMYDLLRTGTVRSATIARLVRGRIQRDPDQPWIAHFYQGVLDMSRDRDVKVDWVDEFEDAAIRALDAAAKRSGVGRPDGGTET